MEQLKKIKVIVQERKTNEGRVFNVYKAVTKDGRLMDCKFRKDVKRLPENSCYMYVEKDQMNIDKNKEYPVLWVKAVEKYEPIGSGSADNSAIDNIF